MIAFVLVIIGGLNWGLIGLGDLIGSGSNWDLVYMIFGSWPMIASLIYLLVGVSAVILAATHKKDCKACSASGSAPSPMM